MARQLRTALPDGFFHITARGVDGFSIYRDATDYLAFLSLLLRVVRRFEWDVLAMCLMPNHYHLVLESTQERLSSGCHRLNGVYAQAFNARHDRRGHLFGDRFWSSVLATDAHLNAACRYVPWNPVRAGLCTRPSEWPWTRSRYGVDAA